MLDPSGRGKNNDNAVHAATRVARESVEVEMAASTARTANSTPDATDTDNENVNEVIDIAAKHGLL
jgi:hypothetical protein